MPKSHWLKLGVVGKPHGIRGAFFVNGRDEPFPKKFRDIVLGSNPEAGKRAVVTAVATAQDRSVISIEQCTSREAAEALAGLPIWIAAVHVAIDEQTEYLWSDITGRVVVAPEGEILGEVMRVVNYGASDVVVIVDQVRGHLEVPFVANFFDMGFTRGEHELRLTVPVTTFDGLWTKQPRALKEGDPS